MKRSDEDWIDMFMDYTENLPSADILKKWSAIACLAGALERRVWVTTLGSPLYPNMYIMLLAPPGIGKSILSSKVGALWRSTDDLIVGSTSLTKASLVDELNMAERNITRPNMTPAVETFNSLQLSVNEMGTFITAYDQEFMTFLTDVYDCGPYSERRRSNADNPIDIEKTQLTLYGCTTTSWLSEIMPEGGWDQGFISRVVMVYSGYKKPISLFAKSEGKDKIYAKLARNLNIISKLTGEFSFEDDAAQALDAWHMNDNPPKPDHPKLQNYNARRTAHIEKMMMVMSASEGNSLVLTLAHFQRALAILLEAEQHMPDVFKAMNTGGDMKVIEECWFAAYQLYAKSREPVREYIIIQFLQERLPAHSVERVLGMMVKARMFELEQVNKVGPCYRPLEFRKIS